MRDQPSFFQINYIFHKEVSSKDKKPPNILALTIMTRSRYISLISPISIKSKNSLEDSCHFFDLNKATREAIDNMEKSQIFLSNFESNFHQKSKILNKKIYVEEFLSTKE